MDQLFALGSIFTGMKILGLAPDEISTALARNRRHSHSSLYAPGDSNWSNPGSRAASTCVGLILPGFTPHKVQTRSGERVPSVTIASLGIRL